MMAAFAEGLSLAEALGLAGQDVLDVVALGAIASPMFALKGPNMAKARPDGGKWVGGVPPARGVCRVFDVLCCSVTWCGVACWLMSPM
jgi:hypothetical protein